MRKTFNREIVEDCMRLPAKYIKEVIRASFYGYSYSVTWKTSISGIRETINIYYKKAEDILILNYPINKKDVTYNVRILRQSCNYVNKRLYFACPNCGKKCYKLYKAPSNEYFTCRTCQNINYEEQKEHNKIADAFMWLKYDRLIEEENSRGKPWKRKRIAKLEQRRWNLTIKK